MHVSLLSDYWLIVVVAAAASMMVFILVAGRHAKGGFVARSKYGWGKWRALSKRAADLQARVALTVFYFTVAAPFGFARTFLADPLCLRRPDKGSAWCERRTRDLSLVDARRQY